MREPNLHRRLGSFDPSSGRTCTSLASRWALSVFACAAVVGLWAHPARAQAVSFTARSVYHGYQIQLDPYGSSDATRSLDRFYAAVEGGAFGLGSEHDLAVVMSLRYDTDFGARRHLAPDGVDIPSLTEPSDFDLLYLYVDWKNMVGHEIDARIGRQLQMDDLDWYVFDGLKLMGHFWREGENHFDVDLYAGIPVRIDTLFSSSEALLGDGTEYYDGEVPFGGLGVGANAYLRVFKDLSISLSWRNELVFRSDDIEGFGPADDVTARELGGLSATAYREAAASVSETQTGLQESLFGGSIGYQLRDLDLTLQAGLVFDLLSDNLDRARAMIGWDPVSNIHLGLDYLRVRPRFVGDSIFNWFNTFPYDRARVEGSWALLDERLVLDAFYFVQAFHGDEVSGMPFEGQDVTHGPGGGVSWKESFYRVFVHAEGSTNYGDYAYGGNYLLAWLGGDVSLLDRRLSFDARLSYTQIQEDWVAGVDEGEVAEARTTYTAAVGVRGLILDWLQARAMYVQNIDPVLEGSYRVYTELAVMYR